MENIHDILILLNMANRDAVDYGENDVTKIINSNMVAVGAESWTIENRSDKLSIDFTLFHQHYRQEYVV